MVSRPASGDASVSLDRTASRLASPSRDSHAPARAAVASGPAPVGHRCSPVEPGRAGDRRGAAAATTHRRCPAPRPAAAGAAGAAAASAQHRRSARPPVRHHRGTPAGRAHPAAPRRAAARETERFRREHRRARRIARNVAAPAPQRARRGAAAGAAGAGAATAAIVRPPEPEPPPPAAPPKPPVGTVTGLPLPRFAALGSNQVNMRIGPDLRYRIEWTYQRRDLPVQIIEEHQIWRKIRDPEGTEGWVQRPLLNARRTFLVPGDGERTLRRRPEAEAPPVAHLKPGVIGLIRRCEAGSAWCEVRVADHAGWLRRAEIWGVSAEEAIE